MGTLRQDRQEDKDQGKREKENRKNNPKKIRCHPSQFLQHLLQLLLFFLDFRPVRGLATIVNMPWIFQPTSSSTRCVKTALLSTGTLMYTQPAGAAASVRFTSTGAWRP